MFDFEMMEISTQSESENQFNSNSPKILKFSVEQLYNNVRKNIAIFLTLLIMSVIMIKMSDHVAPPNSGKISRGVPKVATSDFKFESCWLTRC